jgi:hypothetical protein
MPSPGSIATTSQERGVTGRILFPAPSEAQLGVEQIDRVGCIGIWITAQVGIRRWNLS